MSPPQPTSNGVSADDVSDDISALQHIPWCASLLSDSSYTPIHRPRRRGFSSTLATNNTVPTLIILARIPLSESESKSNPDHDADTGPGPILISSSNIPDTASRPPPSAESHPSWSTTAVFPYIAVPEVLILARIADGITGHLHTAHGGFVATLLDEALGFLIDVNKEYWAENYGRLMRQAEGAGGSTSTKPDPGRRGRKDWLSLKVMTASLLVTYKKPLPAPSVILVRTGFERLEGRKIWVVATIEDGNGTVLSEGKGMFVILGRKAKL